LPTRRVSRIFSTQSSSTTLAPSSTIPSTLLEITHHLRLHCEVPWRIKSHISTLLLTLLRPNINKVKSILLITSHLPIIILRRQCTALQENKGDSMGDESRSKRRLGIMSLEADGWLFIVGGSGLLNKCSVNHTALSRTSCYLCRIGSKWVSRNVQGGKRDTTHLPNVSNVQLRLRRRLLFT
jgi:hypothetical protein